MIFIDKNFCSLYYKHEQEFGARAGDKMSNAINRQIIQGSNALDLNCVKENVPTIVEFPYERVARTEAKTVSSSAKPRINLSKFVFLNSLLTESSAGISMNKATKSEIALAFAGGIAVTAITIILGAC